MMDVSKYLLITSLEKCLKNNFRHTLSDGCGKMTEFVSNLHMLPHPEGMESTIQGRKTTLNLILTLESTK